MAESRGICPQIFQVSRRCWQHAICKNRVVDFQWCSGGWCLVASPSVAPWKPSAELTGWICLGPQGPVQKPSAFYSGMVDSQPLSLSFTRSFSVPRAAVCGPILGMKRPFVLWALLTLPGQASWCLWILKGRERIQESLAVKSKSWCCPGS